MIRLRTQQRASKIAAEYGGSVKVNWVTLTLSFDFPKTTSATDEFECVARVTGLVEGR